jgi:hypothetical protein
MDFYYFTLGTLGVWRITHFLQAEDGPWDLVVRLRRALGNRFWGRLLDCFYCLSLWIAAPFAWLLDPDLRHCFLLWLALSGAAILLERATQPAPRAAAPYWKEEDPHAMLRTEETSSVAGQRAGE